MIAIYVVNALIVDYFLYIGKVYFLSSFFLINFKDSICFGLKNR